MSVRVKMDVCMWRDGGGGGHSQRYQQRHRLPVELMARFRDMQRAGLGSAAAALAAAALAPVPA